MYDITMTFPQKYMHFKMHYYGKIMHYAGT